VRPVNKGNSPEDFNKYQDAGPELQKRLGDYCSYCERQIETNLAVEHIQPKKKVPSLEKSWSNFLLGCCNCNSSKSDTKVVLKDYLWPDCDNTLLAFTYSRGGLVSPNQSQSVGIRNKAKAVIRLCGLDKYKGNPGREPTDADRRWLRRHEIWQQATRARAILVSNNTPEVRELIVNLAVSRGMFSIWWTVFCDSPEMKRMLREAFPGTESACFDDEENLVKRTGGQI